MSRSGTPDWPRENLTHLHQVLKLKTSRREVFGIGRFQIPPRGRAALRACSLLGRGLTRTIPQLGIMNHLRCRDTLELPFVPSLPFSALGGAASVPTVRLDPVCFSNIDGTLIP